jgi:hypothetical protein
MDSNTKPGGCCKKADVQIPSTVIVQSVTNSFASKGSKPDNSRK